LACAVGPRGTARSGRATRAGSAVVERHQFHGIGPVTVDLGTVFALALILEMIQLTMLHGKAAHLLFGFFAGAERADVAFAGGEIPAAVGLEQALRAAEEPFAAVYRIRTSHTAVNPN